MFTSFNKFPYIHVGESYYFVLVKGAYVDNNNTSNIQNLVNGTTEICIIGQNFALSILEGHTNIVENSYLQCFVAYLKELIKC